MPLLSADAKHRISFLLNGEPRTGHAEPRLLLSDFLRHQLGATGTHVGCEHGVCGACTIHLDGEPVRACLIFAVQVDGRHIDTVEGLADEDGSLGILQNCLRKHHALQCGFCTPGILMSLTAYLRDTATPDEAGIRALLSGHLCRCTGYSPIIAAALEAAAAIRAAPETPAQA